MTWLLVATIVTLAAIGVTRAIVRFGHELPRLLVALDEFGREVRPAVVRVRTATDELRDRGTRR
jgi:hypothetical protein